MQKIILSVTILILFQLPAVKGQDAASGSLKGMKFKYSLHKDKIVQDSTEKAYTKNKTQTVKIGGIFISPNVGLCYPLGSFKGNSGIGVVYGAKLEFAFSKLYPFVLGFIYEGQTNKGNSGFMNNNLLTTFQTQVSYLGGSLDFILNKILKSNFTTPVLSLEVKYAKVTRDIVPDTPLPNISADQSLITFSGGLAFTLYIFDINTKYTYAAEYSTLDFQLRFHFPVIKF